MIFSNQHESLLGAECASGRFGDAYGEGGWRHGEVHLDITGLCGNQHHAVLEGVWSEVKCCAVMCLLVLRISGFGEWRVFYWNRISEVIDIEIDVRGRNE